MTQFSTSSNDLKYDINTKIAFSFYDLGLAYEKRCRYDLALENYRKSLDYDSDLLFVKTSLHKMINFLKCGHSNVFESIMNV
ncbi:MAG: tetratricopeptide repeat protein [Vampirovibrionia bacterium]